jgi:hypothetical protein
MPTFEESIDVINVEINKRKNKWSLTVLSWLDFDDVAQIIRLHIYRKWEQYNIEKPLCPMVEPNHFQPDKEYYSEYLW